MVFNYTMKSNILIMERNLSNEKGQAEAKKILCDSSPGESGG